MRSDAALRALRGQILDATRPPGALLAEAAVARELHVSRVPVREALFTLERDGLVEFSDTGRAYVRRLELRDFEELYVMRLTLEPAGARLAAKNRPLNVRGLEANIAATSRARNISQVTSLDLDFHEGLLELAGNARLLKAWRSLRYELELWLGHLHRIHQRQSRRTREITVASHRELLRSIQHDRPEAAERRVREHVQSWREWLPTASSNL